MNAEPGDIESVEGYSINSDYINLNANHTEANQEKATIILIDNIFDKLPHAGVGIGGKYNRKRTLCKPWYFYGYNSFL